MSLYVPTEREVQETIRALMRELTKPPYSSFPSADNLDPPTMCALSWLYSKGYITDPLTVDDQLYSLTPPGWEYSERLRLGLTRYWVKHNWFAVTVAAITLIFSAGSLTVGILNALQGD